MIPARRALPYTASATLIFGVALLFHIAKGINPHDESWFLQVTARVANGEVLYRDVAFGATPLSVYIALLFVKLFGVEVLVIKALNALSFTVTLFLCVRCGERLGLSRTTARAVGAAYLLYALPANAAFGSLYTPLALMLFMACFERTLVWQQGEDTRSLVLAAVCAGLCFGVKQNLGLLACAALVICAAASSPRAALQAVGVTVLSAALTLLPVLLTGALPQLADYGFTGKGTYVELGGITMLNGFMTELRSGNIFRQLYWSHQYFFAPAAFGLLVWVLWRKTEARAPALALLVFAAAALAGVFPRADPGHLTIAHPMVIVALAFCIDSLLRGAFRQLTRRIVYVWLGAGLLALTSSRVRYVALAGPEVSALPHFRGVLVERAAANEIVATTSALRSAVSSRDVFLLSPRAGLLYLVSGLSNPTPYDYPYATTFGMHGEAEVIALVRLRAISACIDPAGDSALTAWALRRTIEAAPHCLIR